MKPAGHIPGCRNSLGAPSSFLFQSVKNMTQLSEKRMLLIMYQIAGYLQMIIAHGMKFSEVQIPVSPPI